MLDTILQFFKRLFRKQPIADEPQYKPPVDAPKQELAPTLDLLPEKPAPASEILASQFINPTSSTQSTTTRKKGMKVDMRKKVSNFQADFKEAFGVNVRVYKGAKFAPDVPLKDLIQEGYRGGELEMAGNTKVKTIEENFQELFGIKIQVETLDGKLADNNATLASLKK